MNSACRSTNWGSTVQQGINHHRWHRGFIQVCAKRCGIQFSQSRELISPDEISDGPDALPQLSEQWMGILPTVTS